MAGRAAVVMAVGAVLAVPGAANAAELQAAYDVYVPGKGFEIGLVNAATGAPLPVPAGVNSADDELHPTLSPDGRFLTFARMHLLPKLNGDITVPEQRQIVTVNLESGAVVVAPIGAGGAGPNYTQRVPGTVQLSWGAQPDGTTGGEGNVRAGMSIDGWSRPTSAGRCSSSSRRRPTCSFRTWRPCAARSASRAAGRAPCSVTCAPSRWRRSIR